MASATARRHDASERLALASSPDQHRRAPLGVEPVAPLIRDPATRGALESRKPQSTPVPGAEADWGRTVGFLDAIAESQGPRCRHPTPSLVERTRMASQSPRDTVADVVDIVLTTRLLASV
jgi:hypothetical protein